MGHWWLEDERSAIPRRVDLNGPTFGQLCRSIQFDDQPAYVVRSSKGKMAAPVYKVYIGSLQSG
eukprot:775519-Alexandrium_andersonii.AAC.1